MEEQQKAMALQQQQFMEFMKASMATMATAPANTARTATTLANTTRTATCDSIKRNTRNNAGRVPTRTCGVCGMTNARHQDKDCFALEENADKRPGWYIKKMERAKQSKSE